jgi:hypothetical protein
MKMTESKVITYASAREAVNTALTQFEQNQPVDSEVLSVVTTATACDLQIRDYLLGITTEGNFNEELLVRFLSYAIRTCEDKSQLAPLYAIKSSYLYAQGERDGASIELALCLSKDSSYPLGVLLARVYGAGWPTEAFAKMRLELHPKVVEGMEEAPDTQIFPLF